MATNKLYQLQLPVFKQGDDLAGVIEDSKGNYKEAFEAQAKVYDEAAMMCRRMAGFAAECQELGVEAAIHWIWINAPEQRLAQLVQDGILDVSESEDESDEDE